MIPTNNPNSPEKSVSIYRFTAGEKILLRSMRRRIQVENGFAEAQKVARDAKTSSVSNLSKTIQLRIISETRSSQTAQIEGCEAAD